MPQKKKWRGKWLLWNTGNNRNFKNKRSQLRGGKYAQKFNPITEIEIRTEIEIEVRHFILFFLATRRIAHTTVENMWYMHTAQHNIEWLLSVLSIVLVFFIETFHIGAVW